MKKIKSKLKGVSQTDFQSKSYGYSFETMIAIEKQNKMTNDLKISKCENLE